jgi:hypothetical protein
MVAAAALIIFLGFAPSFYLRGLIPAPVPPLSGLTMTHGVVFTLWMLLFLTQAVLIRIGRFAWHRELGMLLAVLFGVMIALGVSTAITAGRLGHAPPGSPPPLVFMALPLFGITASIVLVCTALLNRRRTEWHKRLMLAAAFTFTPPGTGRLAIPAGLATSSTWIALGAMELLLAIAIAYDAWRHRRLHPAYVFAAAVYALTHLGIWWAYGSPAWLAFAHRIAG